MGSRGRAGVPAPEARRTSSPHRAPRTERSARIGRTPSPSSVKFTGALKSGGAIPTSALPLRKGDQDMANVTRFDPFNDLYELFNGFLLRPLEFESRGDGGGGKLPRAKRDRAGENGPEVGQGEL